MKNIRLMDKITSFCSYVLLFFLIGGSEVYAQVSVSIDSTSIQIGREIRYKMQVQADSNQIVVFPEGQTFQPLEVIESFTTDTTKNEHRLNLIKEYALIQFDSGHYTIPRQKILIGEQTFFTDSLKVEVRDVLVDTTKQKMYGIKSLVDIDVSQSFWDSLKKILKSPITGIIISLVFLAALAALVYYLFVRKKRKNSQKGLPPYERAILALQQIDESHLLEQDSHKEYYSKLSDTARKYIDEEVYDHAMESTTDELIDRLDKEIKKRALNLDKRTVQELKTVLKTADMAKFANSKPDIETAKADRNVIEKVIVKTKNAIPEPTEEELLADEEYRKLAVEKKRKKNIIIGSTGSAAVIIIIFAILIAVKGFDTVKDTLLGHPTKELAETEWISSTYGFPPVTVATPKVLIRNSFQLTEEQKQLLKGQETFVYGSLIGNFYISVSTLRYHQETEVDLTKIVEGVVGYFESQKAKNISLKNEEYETLRGAKGMKVFGSMEVKNPVTKKDQKKDYLMLNFAESGGFQQVIVVYDKKDHYAKDVAQRIINSVELKSTE